MNIIPAVQSVYLWEGKVEEDTEAMLIIKTRGDVASKKALTDFVRENHPYNLPETIFLPIEGGNPAYLAWVEASTNQSSLSTDGTVQRDPSEL